MACDITQGRGRICKEQLGGNRKLYLYNYVEDPFTLAGGEATAINPDLTAVYEYDLEGDNNTFEQPGVADGRNTGVSGHNQSLNVQFKAMDAVTNAEFNLLKKGDAQAVVKDRNGKYHALGITDGLEWVINGQTGGAKTDFNGYTVTATAFEKDLAPILDEATVTAFLALVS